MAVVDYSPLTNVVKEFGNNYINAALKKAAMETQAQKDLFTMNRQIQNDAYNRERQARLDERQLRLDAQNAENNKALQALRLAQMEYYKNGGRSGTAPVGEKEMSHSEFLKEIPLTELRDSNGKVVKDAYGNTKFVPDLSVIPYVDDYLTKNNLRFTRGNVFKALAAGQPVNFGRPAPASPQPAPQQSGGSTASNILKALGDFIGNNSRYNASTPSVAMSSPATPAENTNLATQGGVQPNVRLKASDLVQMIKSGQITEEQAEVLARQNGINF